MYSETIFRMWFDSSFVSTLSSVRASKGDRLELRPLQYESLLLVLPPTLRIPAYIRSLFASKLSGNHVHDFVCAMRLAIAIVFLSATVVQGSKGATLLPRKLYNATPLR